jgi:hypothetical protein
VRLPFALCGVVVVVGIALVFTTGGLLGVILIIGAVGAAAGSWYRRSSTCPPTSCRRARYGGAGGSRDEIARMWRGRRTLILLVSSGALALVSVVLPLLFF